MGNQKDSALSCQVGMDCIGGRDLSTDALGSVWMGLARGSLWMFFSDFA